MLSHAFGLPLADLLGVLSVLIAFWFAVPQLARLVRTRSAAGVSGSSLANSSVSLLAWTWYGAAHGSVWVVASSVVGLPAVVGTLVVGRHAGLRLRPALPVAWAAVLAVTAVVDVLLGTRALDVVLGCSIAWFVTPAAVTAWRASDVSGIAPQTYALLLVEGVVFGLYGVVAGIGADRVYGAAAVVGSAAVLSRILRVPGAQRGPAASSRRWRRGVPAVLSRAQMGRPREECDGSLTQTVPLPVVRFGPEDTRPLPPVLEPA